VMKIHIVASYHITTRCHNPQDHDMDVSLILNSPRLFCSPFFDLIIEDHRLLVSLSLFIDLLKRAEIAQTV
jgi:hypothetical protein